MDTPRESDLMKTHLDLVDISAIERDSLLPESLSLNEKNDTASTTKGINLKSYEDDMDNLKKENFNLKLRLYFFEEKNGALPEGTEEMHKRFIDLNVINELKFMNIQFSLPKKFFQITLD